jgi:putative transposase
MLIRKTFKYRLADPSKAVAAKLDWVLWRCRELYNSALTERRLAYSMRGVSISYYDQANQLPAIKEVLPEYGEIGSHVLQDTLRRLDKAFAAFFHRVMRGEKAGFPRYQGRNRFDSFTYPDIAGWKLEGNILTLSKIGNVRVKLHRPTLGKVKTVTIKREGEHWYVCFSCELEQDVTPVPIVSEVGIDVGLEKFATLSSGEQIANPRYFRLSADKLLARQQALSRGVRGSHRRDKVRSLVARLHRKVANQRRDFQHKLSRRLVAEYDAIYVEDLQIANMSKRVKPIVDEAASAVQGETVYAHNHAEAMSGLNKSISDAGWGMFLQMLAYKAVNAGKLVLKVKPQYTSQVCSGCGVVVKKELSERWHSCPCGVELDRDVNAAINILRLGTSLRNEFAQSAMLTPLGVGSSLLCLAGRGGAATGAQGGQFLADFQLALGSTLDALQGGDVGDAAGVEDTLEMIALVLEAAGQIAMSLDADFLPLAAFLVKGKTLDYYVGGAFDLTDPAEDAEAAFTSDFAAFHPDYLRVAHGNTQPLLVFFLVRGHIHHDDALHHPHLHTSQPHADGMVHGLEHIIYQLA